MTTQEDMFSGLKRFMDDVRAIEQGKEPVERPRKPRKAKSSTAKAGETASTGGTPPNDTSNQSGGGGGSGGAGGGSNNPTNGPGMSRSTRVLIALAGIIISSLFWVWNDRMKEAYNNSDAGKMDKKIEKMKVKKKIIEAETAQIVALGPQARSSVVPSFVSQPTPVSREQFVSARKQAMIDQCGRKTATTEYKPDIGCFFFDNSGSDVGKEVTLLVRDTLRTVELDGEQSIKVTAGNGESCTVTVGDTCLPWIQQHSIRNAEGFAKFTLAVPPKAGFIANIFK